MAQLNPIWLQTFQTLVELGHFTQTAQQLNMTQPGVSQHIQKLEQACGQSLISRFGKRFELTEAGRLVYQYACQFKQQQASLLASLAQDDPWQGECRLDCSGSLALLLYPQCLAQQKLQPGWSVSIEAAPNERILQRIEAGLSHVGIVSYCPAPSQFYAESIASQTLCLVLPASFAKQAINASVLHQIGVVQHPDLAHYLNRYMELCGDDALSHVQFQDLKVTSRINQIGQILLPVLLGLGFTVLPYSAVLACPYREDLLIHQAPNPVLESLYWVQKRNRQLPKRYDSLKHLVERSLSPLSTG
ncbi:hypothetical protein VST7929_00298 [Vibrio stylophorae]|uniref:HTH lysR-type domain-containing protein n=1 Tax=Vibrio stylophorae TaxID=659351 RepID=A0ABN8DUK0_9VIBR|nr:LysR family transcriptional regulator [Vibrio stylophorae]CAH0532469.1 hypothetical protein VST7929_00298 [Vibrio stylophorae]